MLKSMKDKIEEQIDNIDIKSLSLQFSNSNRHEDGLTIFNCADRHKKSPKSDAAAKAMSNLLPVAFIN
jgi:hypothetical protein